MCIVLELRTENQGSVRVNYLFYLQEAMVLC